MSDKITITGIVDKIIPPRNSEPERVQILIANDDRTFSEILVKNALRNENGLLVGLKQGSRVQITIRAGRG